VSRITRLALEYSADFPIRSSY